MKKRAFVDEFLDVVEIESDVVFQLVDLGHPEIYTLL